MINGRDAPGIFYDITGNMSKINNGKTMGRQFPSTERKRNDFPSPDKYTPLYMGPKRKIIMTYSNRTPL